MKRYNPSEIESKWQASWAEQQLYKAEDFSEKPKFVMLTEFPYPSGDGLHLGHTREYTLGDIMARHKRMNGFNVLYPMGYDAFGLPTENYAIKNKIAPQVATDRNVANFQKQFEKLGYSIDWSRSFRTTDPDYYRWTQWLFLQFFKKGLAYQEETAINWCPHCKTGLANEEVVNGRHERCDTLVEKKLLKQWLLKITQYADRLIEGLKTVDYPSRIADQQVNWIGRSQGAEVDFQIDGRDDKLTVFTTRPDTLFGATFLAIAPEHALAKSLATDETRAKVNEYIQTASRKSEIERQNDTKEKTGVFSGSYAINPVNGDKLPIWIADYILAGYGTGAIMAVPAHDERDFAFASNYQIPIKQVVAWNWHATGVSAPRDGVETLHRGTVDAIIHDGNGNYLLEIEKEGDVEHVHFVGGGIDDSDENAEATVLREVREEVGLTDIASIKKVTPLMSAMGYRHTKSKNQHGIGAFYEVVVGSTDQVPSEIEEGRHTVRWAKKADIASELTWDHHRWGWDTYLSESQFYGGDGVLINSDQFNGLTTSEAREKIVAWLESEGKGKSRVTFKLRDWIFSRQHYWGEPIPIIHCPDHGAVAVPDDQLPVTLPEVEQYEPTDTGESPLAAITDWVNTTCPECGKPAKRETDTMPNWAGSSWYYLRYFDAHNDQVFADRKKLEYWGMVDMYLGGMEHTTLHLLYSRFWHQFFYDQGLVPTPEPYAARRGQGIILAADGSKMSKSKGNVINPNEVIDSGYGADALRVAIAFIAPYDLTTPWSPEGVAGTHRFLNRAWTLVQEHADATDTADNKAVINAAHRTIKKVSRDMENMQFNTAISALMEYVNVLYKEKTNGCSGEQWLFALNTLVQLLAPIAPHMSEELWQQLGNEGSVHVGQWPVWDESLTVDDTITIGIQVNGKLRGEITIAKDAPREEVEKAALAQENVARTIGDGQPKKVIYVPGRLVNVVL